MRRSTLALAVVSALLLAGCPEDTAAPVDVVLDPPPPGAGLQLSIPPFDVPRGTEVQDCYYMRVPGAPGTVYNVNRFEAAMNPGSHHMNLFRVSEAWATDNGVSDGEKRDCWAPLPLAADTMSLIFNNQQEADDLTSGRSNWQLPTGVALKLTAGEWVMMQTHYVNAATQMTPLRGKVLVNLHTIATATNEMCAMFANNRSIRLPPREPSSFTTTCTIPVASHIVGLAGHFHSRGERFTISTYDPAAGLGAGRLLYENTSWSEPPFTTWSTEAEAPALGPMQGFEYTCDFFNDTDTEMIFGPHVENQEHCNLFAYFYPCPPDGVVYCF